MSGFPPNVQSVVDSLVSLVHKKTLVPDKLSDLIEWLEVDGWDSVLEAWDDEQVVMKLEQFAADRFSDAELLSYEEPEGKITNRLRVEFARDQIATEFDESDGSICPSVHALPLESSDGKKAVLGLLVEIHGQAGHEITYFGIFRNKTQFYSELKKTGHVFMEEQESLSDRAIMKLWQK